MERIRVGFIQAAPVFGADAIFVNAVFFQPGDKQFIGFAVEQFFHFICVRVPFVEIADDGNTLCMRSPDAEDIPFFTRIAVRMCAEHVVRHKIFSVTNVFHKFLENSLKYF